jgi:hypothetical protein
MIYRTLIPLFSLVTALALCSGCISVNLSKESLQRAESVIYEVPDHPFKEIHSVGADKTWRNPTNGNTITFVSECGDVGRLNLKDVARTALKAQNLDVVSQREIEINKNRAIESHGKHKSSSAAVELVTIRLKECLFNFAYLGTVAHLNADRKKFDAFVKGFQKP